MTTVTIQQAFEACQTNKNTWLKRKAELADLEREYREQLLAGDEQIPRRIQDLRDNIDVKKWEINQAAGRYIRSYEEVQHISIRNRLHDFMQQHGAELAAGEKINYSAQDSDILTAIGFRPDAASRDDNRQKFTPAQNLIYTRRRAELAAR
ncbi:Polarity suppression protein [Salmonella enterica]